MEVIYTGKTSAAVRNRYIAKAYDRVNLVLKKGNKERVRAAAAAQGESLNGYICRAIMDRLERDGADQPDGDSEQ